MKSAYHIQNKIPVLLTFEDSWLALWENKDNRTDQAWRVEDAARVLVADLFQIRLTANKFGQPVGIVIDHDKVMALFTFSTKRRKLYAILHPKDKNPVFAAGAGNLCAIMRNIKDERIGRQRDR